MLKAAKLCQIRTEQAIRWSSSKAPGDKKLLNGSLLDKTNVVTDLLFK